MTQLVWFRNDLRVADNAALTAACKQQQPVQACFIVTPAQCRSMIGLRRGFNLCWTTPMRCRKNWRN